MCVYVVRVKHFLLSAFVPVWNFCYNKQMYMYYIHAYICIIHTVYLHTYMYIHNYILYVHVQFCVLSVICVCV